jgi:hypothetical protein
MFAYTLFSGPYSTFNIHHAPKASFNSLDVYIFTGEDVHSQWEFSFTTYIDNFIDANTA